MHPPAAFHGILVTRRYEAFAGDAFDVLLSPFTSTSTSTDSAIVITAEHVGGPVAPTLIAGLTPRFFVGLVQVYETDSGYALSDTFSYMRVDCDARALTMRISAESSTRWPGIVATMQHLAFDLLLREAGLFCIHAAAVRARDRAIVIVGECGSGKTTTTLALMAAGSRYLGDDRVLVRECSNAIELRSYPREFHVDAATTHVFSLEKWIEPHSAAASGKNDIAPSRAFPDGHLDAWRGPLAILFPSVVGEPVTRLKPLTRAEAFGRVLGSSAMSLVDGIRHAEANLRVLQRLVNEADVFEVALGRDMVDNPAAAGQALADAVSSASP